MEGFEVFPHTADVGLSVHGKTLPALFENAALGMMTLLSQPGKFRPLTRIPFDLKANSRETLLVDWLHEILYYFSVKHVGFSGFSVQMTGDFSLRAEAWGEKIDPARHPVLREIKAVTYHDLKIEFTEHDYRVKIIFDI